MQRAAAGWRSRCADLLGGVYGARVLLLVGAATTAATRCTPGRCWRARGARSRRCCSSDQAARRRAGRAARPPAAGSCDAAEAAPPDVVRGRHRRDRRPAGPAARGRTRSSAPCAGVAGGGGRRARPASTSTPASSTGPHVRADVTVTFGTHKVAPPGRPGRRGMPASCTWSTSGSTCPSRRGRGAPGGRRRGPAAACPAPTRTSTPAASSASAPARRDVPRRRRAVRRRARVGSGRDGALRRAAPATRCGPRYPEVVVGEGRVQAWVVGPAGPRDAEQALADALDDGVPVVVGRRRACTLRCTGAARRRPLLLTPHAGELARLLGVERAEVEADQLAHARRAAARARRRGAAQGPAHARRRARTDGCG